MRALIAQGRFQHRSLPARQPARPDRRLFHPGFPSEPGLRRATASLHPFRHVLMKVLRASPEIFLALACSLQAFIFCCCMLPVATVLPERH
jgi:hypothetical protein